MPSGPDTNATKGTRKLSNLRERRRYIRQPKLESPLYAKFISFDDLPAVTKAREEDEQDLAFRPRARHVAKDITDQFTRASHALHTGELVKDENFTLFESVQALEIMDPKMDSGYLRPGETLEDQYNVCRELLPEEIIGIMDQMLCYEMSWHQGYPLAQNLFTSHYIDHLLSQQRLQGAEPYFVPDKSSDQNEPSQLIQLVLRSYCIGVIKSIDIVIEIVLSQHFYEEEDFNTNTFGREFLVDMPDEKCFAALEEANKWLHKHCNLQEPVWEALLKRIEARQNFLATVLPPKPGQEHSTDYRKIIDTVTKVKLTHGLGTPVNEAFSAKIRRKLASTVPPRPIVTVAFDTACDELVNVYEDLEQALKVQLLQGYNNLQSIMTFLWVFSSRQPQPSAFVRAVLQRLVFTENKVAGPNAIEHLLVQELQEQLPPDGAIEETFWDVEVPTDGRYKVARMVDYFVERAAPEYQNILRSICQNRCRIRRCLTNIVSDLSLFQETLQAHLDAYTPPTEDTLPVVSHTRVAMLRMTTVHKLQTMQALLQQGFEQSLYAPHELPQTYWLLSQLAAQRATLHNSYTGRHDASHRAAAALGTATAAFADALSRLSSALQLLNALPYPPISRYASPARQFARRARMFGSAREAPSFASWQATAADRAEAAVGDTLRAAREQLGRAKAEMAPVLKRVGGGTVEAEEEAGCVGSGAAWRAEWARALRAVVKCGVGLEGLIRVVEEVEAKGAGEERTREEVSGRFGGGVTLPEEGERDHVWWVVPSWTLDK